MTLIIPVSLVLINNGTIYSRYFMHIMIYVIIRS